MGFTMRFTWTLNWIGQNDFLYKTVLKCYFLCFYCPECHLITDDKYVIKRKHVSSHNESKLVDKIKSVFLSYVHL